MNVTKMNGYGRATSRGLALPLVLVIILVVAAGMTGLHFLARSGMRRTVRIKRSTEHLYLAEAVLAKLVSQIKRRPWELRYYAAGKTPPASDMEIGNYHGADYVAIVQDVTDEGQVVPNLTDIMLRVTYFGMTRNFFARVSAATPTVLRPTGVNIERFTPVPEDLSDGSARQTVLNRIDGDYGRLESGIAAARIIQRRVIELRDQGKTLNEIVSTLEAADLSAEIAAETAVLDKWNEGFDSAGSVQETKYSAAYESFKEAYDLARAQAETDGKPNSARSLYFMAKAKLGEYEKAMAAIDDPLVEAKDVPAVRALLDKAIACLDKLIGDYPDSRDRPYAMLAKVKMLFRLGLKSEAKKVLEQLKKDYAELHMWGEDATVAGSGGKNGIVDFEGLLLDEEGVFFLSKTDSPDEVAQVCFNDIDGRTVKLTRDPRPKDLLTPSEDGSRVAYRAKMPDGGYRLVVIDRDGNTLSDVTWSTGDWKPSWAGDLGRLDWKPVLAEDLPDPPSPSAPVDLSSLPIDGGPFPNVEALLAYADSLYGCLVAPPFSVPKKKLKWEKKAIKKAEKAIAKGDNPYAPPKHKKHFAKKALGNLVKAVRVMENLKDGLASGDDSWRDDEEPSPFDILPGDGFFGHRGHHGRRW